MTNCIKARPRSLRTSYWSRRNQAKSAQLANDKPLWFKDKFSTIAEVNVTYMLIGTEDSHVERAGTATAMRSAHGELGSKFRFDPIEPVAGVWDGDNDRNGRETVATRSFASSD